MLVLYVLPPECESFLHCGVVGFQPLVGLDKGSFFQCGVVEFQPREGTYSTIFHFITLSL